MTKSKITKKHSTNLSKKRSDIPAKGSSSHKKSNGTRTIKPSVALNKPEENLVQGQIYVCGTGDCAQLGLTDDVVEARTPKVLSSVGVKIIQIAVGGLHNLALDSSHKVCSWGCNDQKCLGRSGDEYIPGFVESLEQVKIISLACGDSISAALTDKGEVYTWGTFRNSAGILGYSSKINVQEKPLLVDFKKKSVVVTKIVSGTDHILALTDEGRVYTWGNGEHLMLGRKVLQRHQYDSLVPERLNINEIVDISAGSYHSFAISKSNTVYCWGLNSYGQCTSLLNDRILPETYDFATKLNSLKDINIKQIAGGEHFTLVLSKEGLVYSFGRCDASQLGIPTHYIKQHGIKGDSSQIKAIATPVLIEGLEKIVKIATGTSHSLALRDDGVVFSWGFGESYALGHRTPEDQPTPKIIESLPKRVIDIKCGAQHSVFLIKNENQ